jgi:hypothetical protein
MRIAERLAYGHAAGDQTAVGSVPYHRGNARTVGRSLATAQDGKVEGDGLGGSRRHRAHTVGKGGSSVNGQDNCLALPGEWFLSRRDRLIVARHEVPG